MSGAIPPPPNTPSWSGARLKHRDNFYFTFHVVVCEEGVIKTAVILQLLHMAIQLSDLLTNSILTTF
jgi:hypothetical protein